MQRLEAKINTSRAMRKHQANGRRMGRADRCPFGYAPDPKDNTLLIPDPDEQRTLEVIRRSYQQGMGIREICRHLDRQGRNRRGKTWANAPAVVSAILKRMQLGMAVPAGWNRCAVSTRRGHPLSHIMSRIVYRRNITICGHLGPRYSRRFSMAKSQVLILYTSARPPSP